MVSKAGLQASVRCDWCGDLEDYCRYHDKEWGFPVRDDTRIFEKVCLEGFQAGLSWLTILRKREAFREAFPISRLSMSLDFLNARFSDCWAIGALCDTEEKSRRPFITPNARRKC